MKKTEINDILNYNFLSKLEISPNEKTLAFISTKANEKENKYDRFLNILDLDNNNSYKISDNKAISIFEFDSYSNLIYKEKSDDDFDYFYKKDLSPEVGKLAFKIDKDVESIELIKDDIFLVIASDKKTKEEKEKIKDDDSYFKEVTKLPFWLNGAGFLKYEDKDIYLYYEKEDRLEKITNGKDISIVKISNDLQKLIYTKARYFNGVMELKEDLYIYDIKEKKETLLLENQFAYYDVFFFEDEVFFVATDMKKYGINQDGFIYKLDKNQKPVRISPDDFDFSIGLSTGTDARFGAYTTFRQKDNKIYFLVTEKEDSKIYSFDIKNNELKLVTSGGIEDFALGKDKIYYLAMKKDSLQEIYVSDKDLPLLENKPNSELGKIEEFYFESNGSNIRGYVLLPVGFDPNKKYKTLLSVHGGPKTELSDIFHHEHQVFANDGYIVIYTNPHGASGNGVEYSDIRGKYGSVDYEDLMKFVDVAIQKYPQIDKDNMGVYGGSYGGFMTNWIVSHTDRFKCANAQRSISNWISFYGVSDIGYYFADDQTAADPWENTEKMWELSPLKHAKNVKTPTLFIHSDCDYRCPLEQGLQMYSRIKLNGVEAKMYIFHGENHELSRSGKPKGRIKRLTEIKNWFDGHLK